MSLLYIVSFHISCSDFFLTEFLSLTKMHLKSLFFLTLQQKDLHECVKGGNANMLITKTLLQWFCELTTVVYKYDNFNMKLPLFDKKKNNKKNNIFLLV